MKTITGRQIKVKANEKDLTFDITVDGDTDLPTTYRTIPFSQEEFNSMEFDTANDWQNFLNSTQDYFKI